jgi:hypothetical protein
MSAAIDVFASEINASVTPEAIIDACLEGARNCWRGIVRLELDDGRPVIIFGGSGDDGRELITEAYAIGIEQRDAGYGFFTLQIVDNLSGAAVCGWMMHCCVMERFEPGADRPRDGAAGQALFDAADDAFFHFSQ